MEVEFTRVDEALVRRACEVMDLLQRRQLNVVLAESCTGGLIAAVLSEPPGAAERLHGGFVTYTETRRGGAVTFAVQAIPYAAQAPACPCRGAPPRRF